MAAARSSGRMVWSLAAGWGRIVAERACRLNARPDAPDRPGWSPTREPFAARQRPLGPEEEPLLPGPGASPREAPLAVRPPGRRESARHRAPEARRPEQR